MIRINHHIQNLLSEHDCVIVPNFGAFIAEYSPAVVSDTESTLPSKDILFNRTLQRNDGLLINAIIEEEGINYAEAKQKIATYVNNIQQQISNGESYTFEGVGILQQDEAGFLQFEAQKDNECWRDAYGLRAITLQKIRRSILDSKSDPASTTRKRFITPSRIIAAAAVIILFLVFSTPLSDRPLANHAGWTFKQAPNTSLSDSVVKPQIDTTTLASNSAIAPITSTTEVQTLPLSRKTPQETEVPSPQKLYHVIIASLANEKEATEYTHTFKTTYDFDNIETLKGSGRYRISVAHFDQKSDAVAFVKSIRLLNPKFKDTWVLPTVANN